MGFGDLRFRVLAIDLQNLLDPDLDQHLISPAATFTESFLHPTTLLPWCRPSSRPATF